MSPKATVSISERIVSEKARSNSRSYSSMLQGEGIMTSTSSIPSSTAWRARSDGRTPWWLIRSNISEDVVIRTRGSRFWRLSVQRARDESLPPLQERARPSSIIVRRLRSLKYRRDATDDAAGADVTADGLHAVYEAPLSEDDANLLWLDRRTMNAHACAQSRAPRR